MKHMKHIMSCVFILLMAVLFFPSSRDLIAGSKDSAVKPRNNAVKYEIFKSANAQDALPIQTNSQDPIEITATETLEWHRNERQYIAKGNVEAKQGSISITGNILTADYRESQTSDMEIWRLTSQGNVEIKDETNTAIGDKAIYDVDSGVATLTGTSLKLISPDQTITATQKFEYKTAQGIAKAIGNAKVLRGPDTLEAKRLIAHFNTAEGTQNRLKTMEAIGNVVITTPTETLTGNRAIYTASTNIAELRGAVTIKRGPNILEGARAEVDLETNISKMFGNAETGTRVRGVFYPGSEDLPNASESTRE